MIRAVSAALVIAALSAPAHAADKWITSWAASVQGPYPVGNPSAQPVQKFAFPVPEAGARDQTFRLIVMPEVWGKQARLRFSNALGTKPVTFDGVHVGLQFGSATVAPGTNKPVTFGGKPSVTVEPGKDAWSDNVALPFVKDVKALAGRKLAVSFHVAGETGPMTWHAKALQTSYVTAPGSGAKGQAEDESSFPFSTASWFFLDAVDMMAPADTKVIVAFGDSITDGARSTPDTNNRWPDHLARRLLAQGIKMGVLNAGIGGNRVLNEAPVAPGADMRAVGAGINALARFEHHVLSLPGATHVIVLEGINDIGNARDNPTPSAADLIAAHKQLIEQAHARGLRIIGATLTPFWGAAYYTEAGEAKRQALNEWIRTGKAYDGVVDFDKAARDPADPKKLLEKYDSCDYLHPSDAGYKAMADAIDLSLFRSSPPATASR